jgi:hypothetical protein
VTVVFPVPGLPVNKKWRPTVYTGNPALVAQRLFGFFPQSFFAMILGRQLKSTRLLTPVVAIGSPLIAKPELLRSNHESPAERNMPFQVELCY